MITTNLFLILEPRFLLSTLLLLLTHSVTDYELGHYPRVRLSIDLIYILQRLVHCTHTTEPMASRSHSGGPTTFRQNRSTAMTLSRPLRQTPLWDKSWVAPCLPKAPTATVMAKQNGPKRGQKRLSSNYGHIRSCLLPGPGYRTPITFPRWRHWREARQ